MTAAVVPRVLLRGEHETQALEPGDEARPRAAMGLEVDLVGERDVAGEGRARRRGRTPRRRGRPGRRGSCARQGGRAARRRRCRRSARRGRGARSSRDRGGARGTRRSRRARRAASSRFRSGRTASGRRRSRGPPPGRRRRRRPRRREAPRAPARRGRERGARTARRRPAARRPRPPRSSACEGSARGRSVSALRPARYTRRDDRSRVPRLRRRQPLLRGARRLHPPHRAPLSQARRAVGGDRRQAPPPRLRQGQLLHPQPDLRPRRAAGLPRRLLPGREPGGQDGRRAVRRAPAHRPRLPRPRGAPEGDGRPGPRAGVPVPHPRRRHGRVDEGRARGAGRRLPRLQPLARRGLGPLLPRAPLRGADAHPGRAPGRRRRARVGALPGRAPALPARGAGGDARRAAARPRTPASIPSGRG